MSAPGNKRRPVQTYLHVDDVDQLARQNVQLLTELWIVKDRLAVLEDLMVRKGLLAADEIDNVDPDAPLTDKLEGERESYIKRVMGLAPEERTTETLKAMARPPVEPSRQ